MYSHRSLRFYIVSTVALWGAVALGAVVGRILEGSSPPRNEDTFSEVVSSHPEIEREQMIEWGHQFFDQTLHPRHGRMPSRTIVLQEFGVSRHHQPRNAMEWDQYSPEPRRFVGEEDNMVKSENLEWMLKNVFMYPRNHNTNETAKQTVLKYIVDSFQVTSGLYTAVQNFEPLQFLNIYEDSTLPTGTNIIAILKGLEWGTPNDKPVLVGAHWDTVSFTPGTDDNGSGVAAMLEAARVLTASSCIPRYSIIFVAFDLEEVGSQGSLVFIKDYLLQILRQDSTLKETPLSQFQGAFILDTIMNWNDTEGSQTFPTDWSLVLPQVYDQVADNHYKGDFLSMIYRDKVDDRMANLFNKHWQESSHDAKFRLNRFPLQLGKDLPGMDLLADHLNFLRSDHSRFWYMNDSSIPHTLNALLMTDTGPYRGNMRNCYHTVCDGPEISIYSNPSSLKFLTKITQVVVKTLMSMAECGKHTGTGKTVMWPAASSSSSDQSASPLKNLANLLRLKELIK